MQVRPGQPWLDAVAHTVAVLFVLGGMVALCFGVYLKLLALVHNMTIFFTAVVKGGSIHHPLVERVFSKLVRLLQRLQKTVKCTKDIDFIILQAL